MNLKQYLLRKEKREAQTVKYRNICESCRQPCFSCYCQHVNRFDPKIKFVILMHPIERRRRIATGRMSFLSLIDSELIVGQEFSENSQLEAILKNPGYNCIVLCPGINAVDISDGTAAEKKSLFVEGKKTVIIVIDGTWGTAKKMLNRSPNLKKLQRICFTPSQPSRFRVRKQPRPEYYSTIEAIHHTIELIGEQAGFDTSASVHDSLLNVFDKMVERQLEFMREAFENSKSSSYRKVKRRVA